MKFTQNAVLVLALAAPLALLTAGPASAAVLPPLPPTDTLYALSCHGVPELYEVTTTDSTWVAVGSAQPIGTSRCAYQPAFNPATGESFFLAGNTVDELWPLVRVDVTTGEFTVLHNIWDGTTDLDLAWDSPHFPGNLLIANTGDAYFIGGTKLYPLNLATGVIGPQIGADLVVANGDIYAAACSPVTAGCYVLTHTGYVYGLNVTTGAIGPSLGRLPFGDNYSLQVASDGTLWSSSEDGKVASFSAANPAGTYVSGSLLPDYTGAFLITVDGLPAPAPEPALAATGTDGADLAVGATALLVAGVAFTLLRRRSRTAG